MKRAANQSGAVLPQVSARQLVSEQEFVEEERPVEMPVELEMKSVSNGSSLSATKPTSKETDKTDKEESKESPVSMAGAQNPLQQLQIVRLLTDLGDRLRQSEKEREVLWKEVEICRKQIADMGGREGKVEKNYTELETQMNQREVFVKELLEKQMGLEQKLKDQLDALEASKKEQAKLQEKMNSLETTAGSAIVRVEDAIAENSKLSKRVEQLSQDKTRLVHKLEIVEEALTQTQDILKAKALVLLTDQALASRTNLPQTPAWTGNDTLKVSNPQPAEAPKTEAARDTAQQGPLADIAASLKAGKTNLKMRTSTIVLTGLVVLGVTGGIVFSQYLKKSPSATETAIEYQSPKATDEVLEPSSENDTNTGSAKANQEDLMARAATIASQIEPSSLSDSGETDIKVDTEGPLAVAAEGILPPDFESAQIAQDKAVESFKAAAPTAPLSSRINLDKTLPKVVAEIQSRAFAGDAEAQHDLAAVYTAGHGGVKVNYALAAKWFEESAYGGISNAQYNLGVLYHQGLGVKKDTEKAMELYRVAASQGHPEAQYNLAIAYVEGIGVEYNPQIASVYFEQAASGGIVEAAYNLGLLHENGLLGESQPDEAIFWYKLAADKGNKDADKALKQLKSQLSMSNEDANQVIQKITAQKPSFANAEGKAELPDKKPASIKSAPKQTTSGNPAPVAAKTAPKTTQAADPVIVSQIQEQLIRLGMYKGIPNGTTSPVLSQAIKTYQQKNGMKADGKATDDLLVHMLAAATETKQTLAPAN